jgi:8-oxo-dGTP pyrophosphatase MutT (NUDIX family)
LREVLEETNLHHHAAEGFRQVVEYAPKPKTKKTVVYFFRPFRAWDPIPQAEEISEIKWMTAGDALNGGNLLQ